MINYGMMHATSEAMLMARRIFAQHVDRYRRHGSALLSMQRPDPQHPSPLEEYVAECVVRYDFIHAEDEGYPGIDVVSVCFADAFTSVYLVPLGED